MLFFVSLALAGGGVVGILRGDAMGWMVSGFFVLCAGVLAVAPWLREGKGRVVPQYVTVDDWGVRRKMGASVDEAVAWGNVTRVVIHTNDDGPFGEDFLYVLSGSDGDSVAVLQSHAAEHKLLEYLQKHLPDLDNEQVILAMGCTTPGQFVIWPPASDAGPGSGDASGVPA